MYCNHCAVDDKGGWIFIYFICEGDASAYADINNKPQR
jgi:hypothetical protein